MNITEHIRVDPRLEGGQSSLAWQSRIEGEIDGIHAESSVDNLAGEFLSFNFAGAKMYYLHSDKQLITRPRPCRNRFAPMAIVPVSGSFRVTQLGRTCEVNEGQFVFVDSAGALELDYDSEFRHLFLHFPASSFVPAVFHKAISRTVDGTSDYDFLFKSLIESIWRGAEDLQPLEHGSALNSILSLCPLTTPFRERVNEVEPCIRVTKAMAYIEDNLGECWLTPQAVADAQGVSRRYLDERFGRLGLRVERFIWERRLLRAREELSLSSRVSRSGRKTIIQIALDNGFKSPSHFSRSFSSRFGMSPREYRNATDKGLALTH